LCLLDRQQVRQNRRIRYAPRVRSGPP
jgi:hypothetical protein